MVTHPWFYAAAIPALLVYGISKGGFGGGLGILAVPLLSLTLPPSQVAAILLPCLMLMDAVCVWLYRKTWDGRNLLILVPSSFLGCLLGYLSFSWFNDGLLGLLIGLVAVAFSLDAWLRRAGVAPPAPRSFWKGTLWGTISGYTGFISHAGGPPLAVYLLPQRLEKSVHVGTATMFFAILNLTKLPSFYLLGQLDAGNLWTALVLSPLAPLGVGLGWKLQGRLTPAWFFRIIYALVFGSGVMLVWDGVAYLVAR